MVVSESFTADLLGEECHEHFIEEVLGKPVCDEHTTRKQTKVPSTAERMFFFLEKIMMLTL
jgi:hypothetical protein